MPKSVHNIWVIKVEKKKKKQNKFKEDLIRNWTYLPTLDPLNFTIQNNVKFNQRQTHKRTKI